MYTQNVNLGSIKCYENSGMEVRKILKLFAEVGRICLCFWIGILLVGCRSRLNDGFAIYLIEDDIRGVDLLSIELNELELDNTPIISGEDIVSYTWETHEIELTTDAYERIQELFTPPVPVSGVPFVVTVDGQKIYPGAFWTPLSSLSFDGVTIIQPMDPGSRYIQIGIGYPGDDFFVGPDPRSDQRILRSLESAGILR